MSRRRLGEPNFSLRRKLLPSAKATKKLQTADCPPHRARACTCMASRNPLPSAQDSQPSEGHSGHRERQDTNYGLFRLDAESPGLQPPTFPVRGLIHLPCPGLKWEAAHACHTHTCSRCPHTHQLPHGGEAFYRGDC